jgi:hypothetical protein
MAWMEGLAVSLPTGPSDPGQGQRVLIVGDHPHRGEAGTIRDDLPTLHGMWLIDLDPKAMTCYAGRAHLRPLAPSEGPIRMSTVTFYGSSDDLVEVEGDVPGCDEYNAEAAAFELAGLRIGVEYVKGGVWEIGVMIDDDVPVTATNIRMEPSGYTMRLLLDVPEGSYVSRVREL